MAGCAATTTTTTTTTAAAAAGGTGNQQPTGGDKLIPLAPGAHRSVQVLPLKRCAAQLQQPPAPEQDAGSVDSPASAAGTAAGPCSMLRNKSRGSRHLKQQKTNTAPPVAVLKKPQELAALVASLSAAAVTGEVAAQQQLAADKCPAAPLGPQPLLRPAAQPLATAAAAHAELQQHESGAHQQAADTGLLGHPTPKLSYGGDKGQQ